MNLEELADLLRSRNQLDQQISVIIGRPATAGHIAEFVAAAVFDIDLEEAANNQGYDGHFRTGPLAGRSVNESSAERTKDPSISTIRPLNFICVLPALMQLPGRHVAHRVRG